jgi:hypothetical protein
MIYPDRLGTMNRQENSPTHDGWRFVSFRFVSFRFSQCSGTTHLIEQGDALFHCGGLRHAAAPITSGRRMLLVGFVDVRPVRPTDDAAAAAAAVDDAAD